MNWKNLLTMVVLIAVALPIPAAPTPWDSWRSGYTSCEQGESLQEKGNYTEALRRFQSAKKHYLAVRRARPDWNQRVIAERIAECDRKIAELQRLLKRTAHRRPARKSDAVRKVAASKPAASKPVTDNFVADNTAAPAAPVPSYTVPAVEPETENVPDYTQEYAKLKQEAERSAALARQQKIRIAELDAEVAALRKSAARQSGFEREISNLMRDRRIANEKYAILEQRCRKLEAELNKPNLRTAELENKLVEERMNVEKEAKRAAAAEKKLEENAVALRKNSAARRALEKILQQQKDEIAALTRRNAELQKNSSAADEKVRRQENELTDARKRIAELAEAIEKSGKSINSGELAVSALKRELAKRDETIASLRKEIEAVQRTVTGRDQIIADANSTMEQARRDLAQLRNVMTADKAEIAKLKERNQSLEQDVKQLAERSAALTKRLEERNSQDFQAANAARQTIRKLETDLLLLQNQLVELRSASDSRNSRIADLERQLKSSSAELIAARAAAAGLREQVSGKDKELDQLRGAKEALATLKRNFDALAAENRENRALVAAAKPKEAELARVKLRLLENDRLKADLIKEQKLNEEFKAEQLRLSAELKELRRRLVTLDQARRRIAELEGVERELKRIKDINAKLELLAGHERELTALKIVHNDTRSRLNNAVAQVMDLKRKMKTLETERDLLKKDSAALKQLAGRNTELEAMVAGQHKELDRLQERIKNLQSDAEDKFAEEHRREVAQLRKALEQLGPLNDALGKLRLEHENMKNALDAKIKQLDSRLADSAALIKRKEEEIARLQKLNSELANYRKNSVDALRNSVARAEAERMEKEIDSLRKLNVALAAERDKLIAARENNAPGAPVVPSITVKIKESPEELASNGLLAEKSGRTEVAIWNYRQALAADNKFTPAHFRLGRLLFARKDYAGALPHLSSARLSQPDNIELALLNARCMIELKRFGNAGAIVEPLLAKQPDNYRVHILASLIDAAAGRTSSAENRLITASRLAPEQPEVYIELARLLADQITDRSSEAVRMYEKARDLGNPPVPELEKKLASLLDHRRELIRFLSGAASEAELSGDWGAAVWYYKKLLEQQRQEYVPRLALAQLRSGNQASARETLEFNQPSRLGMAVRAVIELHNGNEIEALHAARQANGAKLPPEWVGMRMELQKLAADKRTPAAGRVLLSIFSKSK